LQPFSIPSPLASRCSVAMGLVQHYLVLYNLVQAAGWAACLHHVGNGLALRQSYQEIYDSAAPACSERHQQHPMRPPAHSPRSRARSR
jgi:hypothetical protein